MFLMAPTVAQQLLASGRDAAPLMACGLLIGEKQGNITGLVPMNNCAASPSCSWRLDPRQLTREISQAMHQGCLFQGIYYTNPSNRLAPSAQVLDGWRYNVPCFVISPNTSEIQKVRAFSINPLLRKAIELPLWLDQTGSEAIDPATTNKKGTVIGKEIETGKDVLLSYDARRLSLYCIGRMGFGKTTFLLNTVEQDISQGHGVCIVDPHGDLIHDILCRIPAHREQDVALWEVHDQTRPFGLNFFACEDVTDPSMVDRVCSQNISMLYKLYHASWGPQMENLLRVTFLTMIYNQNLPAAYRPTLVDVPRLWTDAKYRAFLVGRVPHKPVQKFWETIYNPLKPSPQLEYRLSSSNKIERFLENQLLYNIFGQANNSLNYRQIMDTGGILLINLAKGKLGDDNAGLLGSVIIGQLLQATLTRVDTPFELRRPCHIVVDEYQNFATKTFATLQTEARKFSVDTIVAHQSRAFLDEESKGATGSVGNIIAFGVTGEDAKEMALMFDNTPPEPLVIGIQPRLTFHTSPWEHLIQHGHSNPQVNTLVLAMRAALTTIPKIQLPNYAMSQVNPDFCEYMYPFADRFKARTAPYLSIADVRKFVTDEELRRFVTYLNIYLHQRMKAVSPSAVTNDLNKLMELGPFYTHFRYFEEPSYLAVQVGTSRHEYVVFDKHKSKQLQEQQAQQQATFYTQLEQLAQLLVKEPILINSGQYEEVKDKSRAFADMANETANRLSTMNPHQALCSILDPQGKRVQHLMTTYPPSPITSDALLRVERIRQASRERYGRPQAEVEREIEERASSKEYTQNPAAQMNLSAQNGKDTPIKNLDTTSLPPTATMDIKLLNTYDPAGDLSSTADSTTPLVYVTNETEPIGAGDEEEIWQ